MPYTSGIGFRSWHADHPSFKRLGAGTPSRFALVFTSAIERVPKQNRPILSRACPRVSERILAKKRVSEFPNNSSRIRFDRFRKSDGAWVSSISGCTVTDGAAGALKADFAPASGADDIGVQLDISASISNSIYGGANTVQPSSMRALALIRAF